MSDARHCTIKGAAGGGDRAGPSHQSSCGRGSEVTLAPHLVENTQTGLGEWTAGGSLPRPDKCL